MRQYEKNKKILIGVSVICCALLGFNIKLILDLKNKAEKMEKVKTEKIKLSDELEILEKELSLAKSIGSESTYVISSARRFVEAQVTGDEKILKELLSDKFKVEKKNEFISTTYNYQDEEIEQKIYYDKENFEYRSMEINGFDYNLKENRFYIHIRQIFVDKSGEIISPPTFLNLEFIQTEDKVWEIHSFEFDV